MPSVLDLPYDVLQLIFRQLSPVDVVRFISSSRTLYYPLIDDTTTWRPFCTPYGISDNSVFRDRSFRVIYGRLLYKYGALLGLWCSDYPYAGNILEFRLVPDKWQRAGEPIIVGDVWRFVGRDRNTRKPQFPVYIEFIQIGFSPWRKSTPKTANDVQISWHLRSDRDLGFLVHNGIPPPYIRMDGGGSLATPSLHVIAPTSMTLGVSNYSSGEFPDSMTAAWYDPERGVPRMRQEDPPAITLRHRNWWDRAGNLRYVAGTPKPASISIFPPPPNQDSDVYLPELHNPDHSLGFNYVDYVPRYYTLRTIMQEGVDPALPDWRPETVVGIWLGDYGPHGTECLFMEHDSAEEALRAWKITGDVNIPRGACTWSANLKESVQWEDPSGRTTRAFRGNGQIAHHGFIEATLIPAVVIMSGRDEITVEWDAFFTAKFIRYRSERGRVGD
ncbi:hypothetical protein L226DRAFT_615511 [Lentinus tigrinus ALCF2SS1-7]|uniref:F-box domain-containing protein n=1 Tax=Lentinus tigrinus ALCF2SS1-6 TaxID=1328759 RepID=A0A5C2RZ99_9APHY|nr:hypothetical protein L227DRAFT_656206 [Lentinus tigrinus ALCF2SS1-6]RPD71504.1 hypothetical protein L226DRAFT_615511 [Lentinus tigrinus ALCF2SS1-7]